MTNPIFKYNFEKFLISLETYDLPDARHLSIDFVRMYAHRISEHFTTRPPTPTEIKKTYEYNSGIYGITIKSKNPEGVIARAKCKKFWTRSIEKKVNESRLNYEARNKIVGEQQNEKNSSNKQTQLYCSDKTLKRTKEKSDRNEKTLSKCFVTHIKTGKTENLLEVAKRNEENRASETYHIVKNLEHLADEIGFKWVFITLTAPAKYHPNPAKGKRRYDYKLSVGASHEYIKCQWARIQSVLNTRGIPASPETYFGLRTVEPHKDGSMHWHMLLFVNAELIEKIIKAIREKFKTKASATIVIGREHAEKGSAKAASYIYKYISKSLSKKEQAKSAQNDIDDDTREKSDLATIRNKHRVQAAIKAIGARQYQSIGVNNLITMYRKINKLNMDKLDIPTGSLAELIKEKIWRNKLGFYYMLKNNEPFQNGGNISLVTEPSRNSYGEPTKRVIAIKIGSMVVSTESEYKIERISQMNN
ncbi:replication endonuclease [Pseudomonas guineae]|nr:replication endonuclease [Pseudomonas guineae]